MKTPSSNRRVGGTELNSSKSGTTVISVAYMGTGTTKYFTNDGNYHPVKFTASCEDGFVRGISD